MTIQYIEQSREKNLEPLSAIAQRVSTVKMDAIALEKCCRCISLFPQSSAIYHNR